MATGQWLIATSSISIPSCSAASMRPSEVPPAPQNKSTQMSFREGLLYVIVRESDDGRAKWTRGWTMRGGISFRNCRQSVAGGH
jgi:hypothetical protein